MDRGVSIRADMVNRCTEVDKAKIVECEGDFGRYVLGKKR